MKRVPTAILMSGSGSNAGKILEAQSSSCSYRVVLVLSDNPESNYRRIAAQYGVESVLNDIYRFYGCASRGPSRGLRDEDKKKMRDLEKREAFDRETGQILKKHGVRLVAAAGYNWVLSPDFCREFVIVNVHPGDLRARDEQGQRRFVGLGWIPTAKAILNGESAVHSSTHLLTAELDGGPLARVSGPVSIDLPQGVTVETILPKGVTLGTVIGDINRNRGRVYGKTLLYTHSRVVQERLKERGDWVEFPRTLQAVGELMAAGRLELTGSGVLLDGRTPRDLFLMKEGECG